MLRNWKSLLMIYLGTALLLLLQATRVGAQEPVATLENDANCVSCHEHQYYLYDSGKWFCLCDAPMHCVYCHGGRTDSMVEEIAHEGMVLYPTRNHAERCQACHADDYLARVVTFSSIAGISSTSFPVMTTTAVQPVTVQAKPGQPFLLLRLSRLGPWRLAGLAVLAIGMMAVSIFGYLCWRMDCQGKLQS